MVRKGKLGEYTLRNIGNNEYKYKLVQIINTYYFSKKYLNDYS